MHHIDLDQLVEHHPGFDRELERIAHMGVIQLIEHLESTHHRYLWDELPRLADLLETVVPAYASRHPELLAVRDTLALLRSDLEVHLQREETEVFPMVRELVMADALPSWSCGSITSPISGLLDDHDVVVELVVTLRELTDAYRPPDDACASYWNLYDALRRLDADLRFQVHAENNVLFPAVAAVERRLVTSS